MEYRKRKHKMQGQLLVICHVCKPSTTEWHYQESLIDYTHTHTHTHTHIKQNKKILGKKHIKGNLQTTYNNIGNQL
jgi:hypothetical protein